MVHGNFLTLPGKHTRTTKASIGRISHTLDGAVLCLATAVPTEVLFVIKGVVQHQTARQIDLRIGCRRGENQHAGRRVHNIDIALDIHRNAVRLIKTRHVFTKRTQPCSGEVPRLNAVVQCVGHVYKSAGIDGRVARKTQLPRTGATGGDGLLVVAGGIKNLQSITAEIRYVDLAARVHLHAAGCIELAVAGSETTKRK